MNQRSVWDNPSLQVLRWVAFIPVGLLLGGILQALPVALFDLCFPLRVSPAFVRYMVVMVIMVLGIGAMSLWACGCFMVSTLACRVVAPWPRLAAPIYMVLLIVGGAAYIVAIACPPPIIIPAPPNIDLTGAVLVPAWRVAWDELWAGRSASVWLCAYHAAFFLISAAGAESAGRSRG